MIKLFALIAMITLALHADIKDECYYMNFNQYTEKCNTGQTGIQVGLSAFRSRSHLDSVGFIHTKKAESSHRDKCERGAHDHGNHKYFSRYYAYYMENCMEVLYQYRRDFPR